MWFFFIWIFKNVFQFKWLFIRTLLRKKQIYLCSNFFQVIMLLLPWVIQSMFSLGDIIFSISTTNPPIFPQMPVNYHPKHFILIHPFLGFFLFVCIWIRADILFIRDHRGVNSLTILIDVIKQSDIHCRRWNCFFCVLLSDKL